MVGLEREHENVYHVLVVQIVPVYICPQSQVAAVFLGQPGP